MATAVIVSGPRLWTSLAMRVALARHDIRTVFRLMQRFGYSQRAIAALTGITQAEVSEIMSGRRRILGYAVLERLVEGLGLHRGWAGLAFDDETAALRRSLDDGTAEPPDGLDLSRPTARFRNESRATRRRIHKLLTPGAPRLWARAWE